MKTSLKVLVLTVLVVAISLSIFVPGCSPAKINDKSSNMKSQWYAVGYDRDGNYLKRIMVLPDNRIVLSAMLASQGFSLSTDPYNGLILVTNSKTSKVMTYNPEGKFLYDKSYTFEPHINEKSTCTTIDLDSLVACVKKRKFVNVQYFTDVATKNVYVNNEYRLANPEKVKLTEPVQTAVFEDLQNWREYVIDRSGNKLLSFTPPADGSNSCELYSTLNWTIPKGYDRTDAPTGSAENYFNYPTGVCVDGVGNVYVSDFENNRVQKFEPDGEFSCSFAGLNKPLAVAANENSTDDKRIYIANSGGKNVLVKNSESGKAELTITNDQFSIPSSITIGLDGSIWVGDCGADKLFKFSGMNSEKPGQLLLTINDVLSSKKLQKNVVEVELKKYSAKLNGESVKIKPYAQVVDKIDYIPLRWISEILLSLSSDFGSKKNPTLYWNDRTKVMTIKLEGFKLDDGSDYEKRTVQLKVGSDVALVNDREVKLEKKIVIIDASIFTPMMSIGDLFGAQVSCKDRETEPVTMNNVYTFIFPPLK